MKILFTIIITFLSACKNSSGLNYPDLAKSYNIKIDFTVSDGSNYLTLLKHVEKIKYRITKLEKKSNDVLATFIGINRGITLLLTDEIYKEGQFSAFFTWIDKNEIELYVLTMISDTLIRKKVSHSLDWRIRIKRRRVDHEIISDLTPNEHFKFLNVLYFNADMDSLYLDSLKSTTSKKFQLGSVLSGNYIVKINAVFERDHIVYQRDTLIENVLLGINSETTTTQLKTFLH